MDSKAKMTVRHMWLFLVMLLLCSLYSTPLTAGQSIRVGYFPLPNFQEYDAKTGQYRGYGYEYLIAIGKCTGWQYEFVPVSYDEGLHMLNRGEIDLMNNVERNDDTQRQFLFASMPTGVNDLCLTMPAEDTALTENDVDFLKYLTVALVKDSPHNAAFFDFCHEKGIEPQTLLCHTEAEAEAAVRIGTANTCIKSSLSMEHERILVRLSKRPYYFAFARGRDKLCRQLNRALESLDENAPGFSRQIYDKYYRKSEKQPLALSASEESYLRWQTKVTVAYDPSWFPLSYRGNNTFAGAIKQIYDLLTEKTGLNFEFLANDTYMGAQAAFIDGKTEIMAEIPFDYLWAQRRQAALTRPFTSISLVAAFLPGKKAPENTVALPAGYYQEFLSGEVCKTPYTFHHYRRVEDCLNAVMSGEVSCTFLNTYQLEYYRGKAKYHELSFKVLPELSYRLSIGVSNKADSRLLSILDKALDSIGTDEIEAIFRRLSLSPGRHSLIDQLYANPEAALYILLSVGFLAATLLFGTGYALMLRKKNAQLQLATNAKSEFLSNVSHDMRTPLNGVLGFTDLAMESNDLPTTRLYLEKIRISGSFLLSLINDTLDISKIESGVFALKPENVDLRQLIDSVTTAVQSSAKAKGIFFTEDTSSLPFEQANVDRVGLQKIFLNLLSNAVKYTPDGGHVKLLVKKLDPPFKKANCLISVCDNGIGIGKDYLPKLFEPFTREDTGGLAGTSGTGLGLAIIKKIVDKMGGWIEVQTEKGKGSQFDVYLPLKQGEKESAYRKAVNVSGLRGTQVLLCEDNELNRELAAALLKRVGVSVTFAVNGKDGCKKFETSPEHTFAAILMDLRMPIMNGFEATRSIRAMHRADAATVPILAMSADAYEEDVTRCMAAGMNGHIAKPIEPERMYSELARFICR